MSGERSYSNVTPHNTLRCHMIHFATDIWTWQYHPSKPMKSINYLSQHRRTLYVSGSNSWAQLGNLSQMEASRLRWAKWVPLSRPCSVLVCLTWAWCCGTRVQWSQWFSEFRGERSSSKETEDERKQCDCKRETKTRLRSNYSYYRILIVEDMQPIVYECKQRWVME